MNISNLNSTFIVPTLNKSFQNPFNISIKEQKVQILQLLLCFSFSVTTTTTTTTTTTRKSIKSNQIKSKLRELREFTSQQFQMSKHLISCCNFYLQLIQEPSNKLVQFHSLSKSPKKQTIKQTFTLCFLFYIHLQFTHFKSNNNSLVLHWNSQEFVTFQNPKHKQSIQQKTNFYRFQFHFV
jgi:hypothetical protein